MEEIKDIGTMELTMEQKDAYDKVYIMLTTGIMLHEKIANLLCDRDNSNLKNGVFRKLARWHFCASQDDFTVAQEFLKKNAYLHNNVIFKNVEETKKTTYENFKNGFEEKITSSTSLKEVLKIWSDYEKKNLTHIKNAVNLAEIGQLYNFLNNLYNSVESELALLNEFNILLESQNYEVNCVTLKAIGKIHYYFEHEHNNGKNLNIDLH